MNKVNAFNWSNLGQSLLDIAIKVGVGAVLLLLNYVATALSNGSIQLPYAPVTLPILTLLGSQADNYFVNWSAAHATPTVGAATTTQ